MPSTNEKVLIFAATIIFILFLCPYGCSHDVSQLKTRFKKHLFLPHHNFASSHHVVSKKTLELHHSFHKFSKNHFNHLKNEHDLPLIKNPSKHLKRQIESVEKQRLKHFSQNITLKPPILQTTTKPKRTIWKYSFSQMMKEPMVQLFGVVFILFLLTAVLASLNFLIWHIERSKRRGSQWRSNTAGDVVTRPSLQAPKRSFHIQHALYKNVRRPSTMPA